MTRRALTDEEIAEALIRTGKPRGRAGDGTVASGEEGGTVDRDSCVHEERLWDLARGSLDPERTAEILDHTLDCADCSLALRVAHETFAASGMSAEVRGPQPFPTPASRIWSLLTGSILRPAPALAYLVLLLLSYPLYRVMTPSAIAPGVPRHVAPGTPTPAGPGAGGPRGGDRASGSGSSQGGGASVPNGGLRSLRVVRLSGDLSLRGGKTELAPVRVRLGETDVLALKLFPDVDDLPKDRGTSLLIRVLEGTIVVAEAKSRVADLGVDQSFTVVLDRERLRPGSTYSVEVGAVNPAAGKGGAAPPILRQSFRLDPD